MAFHYESERSGLGDLQRAQHETTHEYEGNSKPQNEEKKNRAPDIKSTREIENALRRQTTPPKLIYIIWV